MKSFSNLRYPKWYFRDNGRKRWRRRHSILTENSGKSPSAASAQHCTVMSASPSQSVDCVASRSLTEQGEASARVGSTADPPTGAVVATDKEPQTACITQAQP